MERPPIRYTKTSDGLHIAYQVVGSGPFDLVYTPGWFSNLECAWEVPELGGFLVELASLVAGELLAADPVRQARIRALRHADHNRVVVSRARDGRHSGGDGRSRQ